jgi:hypothetical protein
MPKDLSPPAPTDPSDFIALGRYLRVISQTPGASVAKAGAQLGVNRRKAQYLAEIAKAIDGLDIPDERLRRIGWTKLMVIAPRLDADNTDDLLTAAETRKVPDLQVIVAGREPAARRHVMKFDLDDAQHAVVRAALRAHGATPSTRGLHGKEAALVAALTAAKG